MGMIEPSACKRWMISSAYGKGIRSGDREGRRYDDAVVFVFTWLGGLGDIHYAI